MAFQMLIDGRLVDGAGRLEVVNPATSAVFAVAPRADAAQAHQAITAAKQAFPAWAALTYEERGACMRRFADAIESRLEEFATLLTQEQGKPLDLARYEMAKSVEALRYFSGQTLKPRTLRETPTERVVEQRYPQGVVAAITPWNFPMLLLMYKVAAALVTGNTVIAKPAPTTPLTTLLLGDLAAPLFPAGVFQTLVDRNDLGPVLTGHPDVAHVSFTGSTPTGKKVLANCAETIKRFTLELGGNDAAIVLDDAHLDEVAPKVFRAAMVNAGQVCLAAKRIYVPHSKLDELCERLGRLASASRVGDGMDPATTVGPIQNQQQYEKVRALVEQAKAEGTVVGSTAQIPAKGFFIAPTIIKGLGDDAHLVREEQFGPVVPVLGYDTVDDAIARVNDSEYGLGATVWTSNVQRGFDVATRIEAGTVWINTHLSMPLDVPFGGAKKSGLGRQNGIEGMEDFTQVRMVHAAIEDTTRSGA